MLDYDIPEYYVDYPRTCPYCGARGSDFFLQHYENCPLLDDTVEWKEEDNDVE